MVFLFVFSSFCVYVGLLVAFPMVLQVVYIQVADFPATDLHWDELHYLGEFLFDTLG